MEEIRGQRFWSKQEVPYMTIESLWLTVFSHTTKHNQGMLKFARLSASKASKEELGFLKGMMEKNGDKILLVSGRV